MWNEIVKPNWIRASSSASMVDATQCSFTCGSVRRVISRASVSSVDLRGAMQRQLVHLVQRQVHEPRHAALDHQAAADQAAHHVAHRAELAQRHQRAEVAVAIVGSGLPASRRCTCLTISDACWCAACARGGTNPPLPWSASGQGQAAQSPMAKTSSSSVVCSVGRTTSWLMRLVSSPSEVAQEVGRLHASGPDHQFGRNLAAIGQAHAVEAALQPPWRRCAPARPALAAIAAPTQTRARAGPAARASTASIRCNCRSLSGSMRSRP